MSEGEVSPSRPGASRPRHKNGALCLAGLALVLGGFSLWSYRKPLPQARYEGSGFGGWVVEPHPPTPPALEKPKTGDPLQSALDAYNGGDYRVAERGAEQLIRGLAQKKDPRAREQVAKARWVHAFSAARRKEFQVARERFRQLRREASGLPSGGEQPAEPGRPAPSLEEEGAYQHAVLTGAMGEKSAAEREFLAFMREYPESPLVHAAVKRIARLHGGDVPKEAEAVWRQAVETARKREEERERQASLCGPQVLAELLRRFDLPNPGREVLAREMATDHRGTTLKALVEAAQRRGFTSRGLQLTWQGLRDQWRTASQPGTAVVALIQPGHYVLVESVSPAGVQVWDPSPRPQPRTWYAQAEWQKVWSGVTLIASRRAG